MNTNKAAYWIAVGALALGLNSEYRRGNFVPLHRIADRAGSAMCRITSRAEKTLAIAKFLAGPEVGLPETLVASAGEVDTARSRVHMLRQHSREEAAVLREEMRDQVRDEIRARAEVNRARAEMQRAEMEIQLRTRSQVSFANINLRDRDVTVFCPTTAMRIARTTIARTLAPSLTAKASDFSHISVGETF
jgi:hypothetical protein